MKNISVSKIDKTKRLTLSRWQLFGHYFLGLIPIPIIIDRFYNVYYLTYVDKSTEALIQDELLAGIFRFSSGLGILFSKWYRLKFRQFDVPLTQKVFKDRISQIPQQRGWNIVSNTNNYAELVGGSHWTWGLKMTIIRRDRYILVNSICNPDRPACISVLFENERNITYLKKFMRQ